MSKTSSSGGFTPGPGLGSGNISRTGEKFPQLRVLVVDDEPLIRWSLRETLEQSGHTVVEAEDRDSALRRLSEADVPFDVVLLDYRMPGSNDLSLLAAIRRLTPSSAVIMMTAFDTPEITAGALDLGAYRLIRKPFEVSDVAALVLQAHTLSAP